MCYVDPCNIEEKDTVTVIEPKELNIIMLVIEASNIMLVIETIEEFIPPKKNLFIPLFPLNEHETKIESCKRYMEDFKHVIEIDWNTLSEYNKEPFILPIELESLGIYTAKITIMKVDPISSLKEGSILRYIKVPELIEIFEKRKEYNEDNRILSFLIENLKSINSTY